MCCLSFLVVLQVLLYFQYWLLRKALAEEEHTLSFTVPVGEPLPPQYFVRLVSDRWIGCESSLAVSFRGVGVSHVNHILRCSKDMLPIADDALFEMRCCNEVLQ